jgi:hypothetical protein
MHKLFEELGPHFFRRSLWMTYESFLKLDDLLHTNIEEICSKPMPGVVLVLVGA